MTNNCILTYGNAMEPLVIAELEKQIQNLSPELVQSINLAEAVAYALNRLPPLYSTTEEGWEWQQQRAKETFADLITKAAGWGLAAVQRKPSRSAISPLRIQVNIPKIPATLNSN
jgi:Late competence development protein ComFB